MLYGGLIMVLACLLALSIFTGGFGMVKSAANATIPVQPAQSNQTNQTQPSAPQGLQIAVGDMPARGQASAPVTWVMFSDYQCPYCAKIYLDAEAKVKTNYVQAGKVKMYFRDYPLPFHPNALPAAVAARCAGEEGKFWEMHDKLFDNQNTWSGSGNPGDVFKGYAVGLGLNNATFSACFDAQEPSAKITADQAQGQSYGVGGTPSNFLVIPKGKIAEADLNSAVGALNAQYGAGIELFVNSDTYVVLIPGAYPYSAFDSVLSKVKY